MAKRVHQLAKELGVKSTSIVDKCKNEGLDVKNHMAILSAGLEATIREWFSEGEHSMTVEVAAPVDLDKVKVKRTRKKSPSLTQDEAAESSQESEVVTADEVSDQSAQPAAAAEAPSVEEEKPLPKRLSPQEVAAMEESPAEEPIAASEPADEDVSESVGAVAETPSLAEPPAVEPIEEPAPLSEDIEEQDVAAIEKEEDNQEIEKPAALRMIPEINRQKPKDRQPLKPEPAAFVPKPAALQGPRVVRVERPEVTAPISRSGVGGPRRPFAKKVEPDVLPPQPAEGLKGRKTRKRRDTETTEEAEAKKVKRPKRRGGTGLDEHEWGDRDLLERQERLEQAAAGHLHGHERRISKKEKRFESVEKPRIEKAEIKEPITVKDLSAAIGIRSNEIIAKLMGMGIMATINQSIDSEAAVMIALEYGVELSVIEKRSLLMELQESFDAKASDEVLKPRPPVVAFLGHVDHGKTSLLDRIRKENVVSGEAGGITQHIGSYLYDDGVRRVTFLDTPGHAAFTAMRARGANMTDIVVLVVAADDGVMPQTEEAINHAKAAGVSIVVAMNKIDLPNADENRVLGQLSEKGLIPTEWGGTTEIVRTSAATGEGISDLVEHLDYIAELRELKAPYDGPAAGWVIEAEKDSSKGILTRLLVRSGSLRPGDVVITGGSFGKVRTMIDAMGKTLKEATPATPVEISGLDEMPVAGDRFYVVDDLVKARQIVEEQRANLREKTLGQRRLVTLENLFTEIAAGELKEFNVIVKADVQGSVDVLVKSVQEMNTSEVAVKVLHAAVGGITESDVLLAEASNAIIIGFQVIADEHARVLAEREGVEIRLYRIIYQITDDLRKALEGMLAPRIEEKEVGVAEVRDTFKISRIGVIAGCMVTNGVIQRSAKIRLIRDNIVVRDDLAIDSLRRLKDDASEVRSGFECGIKLVNFDDLQVGDRLEAFEEVKIQRTLDGPGVHMRGEETKKRGGK